MAKPTSEQLERFHALIEAGMITSSSLEIQLRHHERRLLRLRAATPTLVTPHEATEEQLALRRALDATGASYPELLVPPQKGDKHGARLRNILLNFSVQAGETRLYPSTIRMLVHLNERQVVMGHDMGPGRLEILKARLAQAALRFGMSEAEISEAFGPKLELPLAQKQFAARRTLDRVGADYPGILIRPETPVATSALCLLQTMCRSGRVQIQGVPGNTLRSATTIRELVRLSPGDFPKIDGSSAEIAECVQEALAAVGLRLGMNLSEVERSFRPEPLPEIKLDTIAAAAS